MKFKKLPTQGTIVIALCGMLMFSGSCRKPQPVPPTSSLPPVVVPVDLKSNTLHTLPGAVYQAQSTSPIHWQPWTKETLTKAREARRLLFCVIVMPQQPGFCSILDEFASDPAVVAIINENYVPVLIDGDACREMGLLTADLCVEIKRPLNLPVLVWMTHEGNPVASRPSPSPQTKSSVALFLQSHSIVSQMWKDSWEYVLKNSALDNGIRRKRFEERRISRVTSNQPVTDVLRSLRQLASLYDSYSRSFDDTGALFPSSSLELLAVASVHPGLPEDLRVHCLETTRELLADLLPSAMFDPLDGGVFLFRKGPSWALPSFTRDCPGQAKAAQTLFEACRATHDGRAQDLALGVISFAEKNYLTSEGLFSLGFSVPTTTEKWLWSVEDIQSQLSPEDAKLWIKATAMKGLGNVPFESDPRREFFRGNTVGFVKSMADLATDEGVSVADLKSRLEKARSKLLAFRDSRMPPVVRDECSHAEASFRMVSAYAAAFCATGDEAYRGKAISLLKRSRESFEKGVQLRLFSKDAPDSIGAGRAFLYALALQAVLDVASITSDEEWLVWADDLATIATEKFTKNGFLKECPDEAKIIDLPITDLVMLFDDSSAGLFSNAEQRLAAMGRPLVPGFVELCTPMPTYILDRPVLHTDLLLAALARHYKMSVISGGSLSPGLKLAVERLPLRTVPRRAARAEEQVPAGAVKVIISNGESRLVTTPEDLFQSVSPSPIK